MHTFFSFIIVLGLLIFVHEFGHFLWAKIFKVRVLKFSLGFGPKLLGFTCGETEYVLSVFPLGGYVKMHGENPGEEVPEEEAARSFSLRPVWQRFVIVAGGPLFNLFFAVLLFFMIFSVAGLPVPVETTRIGGIGPDSPAAAAGLLAGDIVQAINGEATNRWEEVSTLIRNSGGKPVVFTVKRGAETLELTAQPAVDKIKNIFGEEVGERLMVGIARAEEVSYEKVSMGRALSAGFSQTWDWMYLTIMGLIKIIQKVIPATELGGPILIAKIAGERMEAGWVSFLYFMAVLSVNLGILNLLPIPILDGGHLVFFSVEAVLKKPLSLRSMEIMQQIGLVLLGTLMLFVFYNDLVRVFG